MSDKLTRRILIGLNSSHQSLAALEKAADLAAQMRAELVGVFVVDDNLLRLAALPCAWEVRFGTAKARNLSQDTVERTFAHMANEARATLERVAARRHVHWSFSSTRGSVAGCLLESISGESKNYPRGRPARAGVGVGCHSVLLLQIGQCEVPQGKAVVILNGRYATTKFLPTALGLAELACTEETLVLVIAESMFEARRQQDRVADILDAEGVTAMTRSVMPMGLDELLYFLKNENCGTLILSGTSGLFDEDTFARLVESTEFPIFVVS